MAEPASRPAGRGWRRLVLAGALAVIVVAGVVVGITRPFASSSPAPGRFIDNAYPTGLATVSREDLSSQTQVTATLGYAGRYAVVNQAQGTVTALPGWARWRTRDRCSTG